MRGRRLGTLGLLGLSLALLAGCARYQTRRPIAAAEPPLDLHGTDPAVVAGAPPARPAAFADRHPLFTKPREYYEISGENKLIKVGAATLVGIPAGILGEMRQIVIGQPPATRY
jgi:hypothetical protein